MTTKIIGTGSYLPEHVVSNDDLAKLVDTSDEWIASRTGIRNRRIATKESGADMAAAAAEEALKDLISPNAAREVTPQLIINIVSEHFGITPLDLVGQKRSKELVFPRQIVMYLCGDMTSESLQNIGKALGGRDHTTIIHGTKKIASELKTDENLKNTIDILKKKINPQ